MKKSNIWYLLLLVSIPVAYFISLYFGFSLDKEHTASVAAWFQAIESVMTIFVSLKIANDLAVDSEKERRQEKLRRVQYLRLLVVKSGQQFGLLAAFLRSDHAVGLVGYDNGRMLGNFRMFSEEFQRFDYTILLNQNLQGNLMVHRYDLVYALEICGKWSISNRGSDEGETSAVLTNDLAIVDKFCSCSDSLLNKLTEAIESGDF